MPSLFYTIEFLIFVQHKTKNRFFVIKKSMVSNFLSKKPLGFNPRFFYFSKKSNVTLI